MGEPAKAPQAELHFLLQFPSKLQSSPPSKSAKPPSFFVLCLDVRIAGGGGTKRSAHQSDRRIFLSFLVAAEATPLVRESILNEKLSEKTGRQGYQIACRTSWKARRDG